MSPLLRIAKQYGTPVYAYDLAALRLRLDQLLRALPPERIRYSLKANPALGLCRIIAARGIQADVSSLGELETALAAGFRPSSICLSGPYKSESLLEQVESLSGVTLSIDSACELDRIAKRSHRYRIVLRLKADGESQRFGIDPGDLPSCRELLNQFEFVGFHFYSRSQILRAELVVENLRRALKLACKAADLLGCQPQVINFGAGLGVPYKIDDVAVDFQTLVSEMCSVEASHAPAPVTIELGRYVVAEVGWYLTSVVGHQRRGGIAAVVVDGGSHQRSDLCRIGLCAESIPPLILAERSENVRMTSVLGCLCLATDVLVDRTLMPTLEVGDVLAFPNAGAYGPTAAPLAFLGHPPPLEVLYEGNRITIGSNEVGRASVNIG